jgi:rhodanese-related sulfurtransferase
MSAPQTISREKLEQKLSTTPDNASEQDGYALVNVLAPDVFMKEHIPDSINIPAKELDRFEKKFSRDKEIVVYCASQQCDASPKAARELMERGFSNVYDYEGGMKSWKQAGNAIEGSEATQQV